MRRDNRKYYTVDHFNLDLCFCSFDLTWSTAGSVPCVQIASRPFCFSVPWPCMVPLRAEWCARPAGRPGEGSTQTALSVSGRGTTRMASPSVRRGSLLWREVAYLCGLQHQRGYKIRAKWFLILYTYRGHRRSDIRPIDIILHNYIVLIRVIWVSGHGQCDK